MKDVRYIVTFVVKESWRETEINHFFTTLGYSNKKIIELAVDMIVNNEDPSKHLYNIIIIDIQTMTKINHLLLLEKTKNGYEYKLKPEQGLEEN